MFTGKEERMQKKAEKKKAKAEKKRRKKVQSRLDRCLVAMYFLLSLAVIAVEMYNNREDKS